MIYLPRSLPPRCCGDWDQRSSPAVAAALAYNFFFTEPVHTLRIDQRRRRRHRGRPAHRRAGHQQARRGHPRAGALAAAHAARNATIAGFAGRLLSSGTEAEIAETACSEFHHLFDCNATLVVGLPHPKTLAVVPAGNRLTPSDLAAAALTLECGDRSGRGTARIQPAEWQFSPVRSEAGVIAALGVARDDGTSPLSEEQLPLLGSLLDQLALALERERLAEEARNFAETRKRDLLRTALLASIGQEVRPRLEAIGAAARELRRSAAGESEMVSTIGVRSR